MNKEELLRIAGVCRIALTEPEIQELLRDVENILAYMQQLSEINSETYDTPQKIVSFREDHVSHSSPGGIRSQFSFSLDNKLKVPRGI